MKSRMENKVKHRTFYDQTTLASQVKGAPNVFYSKGSDQLRFEKRAVLFWNSLLSRWIIDIIIDELLGESQGWATTGSVVFLAHFMCLRRRFKSSKFDLKDESFKSVYFINHAAGMSL